MTKLFLATACAALLAITAGVTASQAKGKWTGSPPGWTKGEKTGWDGRSQPPGWSKGKRKGWNGQRVPPGWR